MPGQHFVYIYRDLQCNPVYVGQGLGVRRPGSHTDVSHNAEFNAWLQTHRGEYRIEVMGPLGSKKMADAVETAVISACKPAAALRGRFFNEHGGNSEFRFRPYGVPEAYAPRIEQPLTGIELDRIVQEHGPVMFVYINEHDAVDGPDRVGYNLAQPPTDIQVKARVECWWQVKKFVRRWSADPRESPALLVGVAGGAGSQLVIAAAHVNRAGWDQADSGPDGLLKVPLLGGDLDACSLRGRPITRELRLRFNSFRHSQFRIYGTAGFETTKLNRVRQAHTAPAQPGSAS